MRKRTNKELIAELRRTAMLQDFGTGFGEITGDQVREVTRLYRETWLRPLLDDVEKRLCRRK